MISTTQQNKKRKGAGFWITIVVPLVFWIVIWYIAAEKLNKRILLPSPIDVFVRLKELLVSDEFNISVFNSFCRILKGFLMGVGCGVVLAVISGWFKVVKIIFQPFLSALKSVPVASFVILALIWLETEQLSSFVAFVMVLPIIYINVLNGIDSTDEKMIEMAKVFCFSPLKKLIYIYLPSVIPFFKAACSVALGLCWKAGVAAELIGVPPGTIGEQLYFSKIYILTEDLFAWTIVIIFISVIFEKLFMFGFKCLVSLYERL